jgi:glycosyltransferase involved in cell wall biosynthesis
MKILFVAPLHYPQELAKARAATPPGEPPPLFPSNMAQHFYVKALRAQGHEVFAFYRSQGVLPGMGRLSEHWLVRGASQRAPKLNPDYRLRNARLLEMARRLRPDMVYLTGDNEVIYPETLARIKAETGAKLVYATGTSPIVFSHANERAAARLYDLVVVNDYYHGIQWLELGAPRMECLPNAACDPDFHHPYDALSDEERTAYGCDVGFVGTLYPDKLYGRRIKALEALRDFDLGIWSVHPVPDTLKPFVRGRALGAQMLRILSAARIALNPHGDFMRYGGNLRLFELAGIVAFQIADDLPGVRTWFTPGETIETYATLDDLRAKVAHYLDHPEERARIAAAARAHVYAEHTYDQRVKRLLGLVESLPEA